jgi:hypothetical protein
VAAGAEEVEALRFMGVISQMSTRSSSLEVCWKKKKTARHKESVTVRNYWHICGVTSNLADARRAPSGENATALIALVCSRSGSPVIFACL